MAEIKKETSSADETMHNKSNVLGWKKIILFFVAFFGFSIGIGAILFGIVGLLDTLNGSNLLDQVMSSDHYLLLVDAGSFLLALLIFKSVRDFLKGAFTTAPFKQGKTYLLLLVAFSVQFASQYLWIDILHLEHAADLVHIYNHEEFSMTSLNLAIFYLAFTVITPIKEEIVWRGVLYGFLQDKYKFWIGFIVSTIVFGLVHPDHFVSTAMMGMIFILLYHMSKSLLVPILFHIIWNVYAVTAFLTTM